MLKYLLLPKYLPILTRRSKCSNRFSCSPFRRKLSARSIELNSGTMSIRNLWLVDVESFAEIMFKIHSRVRTAGSR